MAEDNWESDKQWLEQVIGSGQPPTQSQPGSLPSGIPAGVPYVSGVSRGKLNYVIPPPVAEVQRQIAIDRAKAEAKASAKPIPSHQITVIKETQDAKALLDEIISDMEKNKYQTGPLSPRFYSGKIGNVAMQYRGTTGESSFKKKVKNYQNVYSHVQTGANRGFKEIEWMNAAIPGAEQDVPEKFLDAAYQARAGLESNLERMKSLLSESGYNTDRVVEPKKEAENKEALIAEARRRGLIK